MPRCQYCNMESGDSNTLLVLTSCKQCGRKFTVAGTADAEILLDGGKVSQLPPLSRASFLVPAAAISVVCIAYAVVSSGGGSMHALQVISFLTGIILGCMVGLGLLILIITAVLNTRRVKVLDTRMSHLVDKLKKQPVVAGRWWLEFAITPALVILWWVFTDSDGGAIGNVHGRLGQSIGMPPKITAAATIALIWGGGVRFYLPMILPSRYQWVCGAHPWVKLQTRSSDCETCKKTMSGLNKVLVASRYSNLSVGEKRRRLGDRDETRYSMAAGRCVQGT